MAANNSFEDDYVLPPEPADDVPPDFSDFSDFSDDAGSSSGYQPRRGSSRYERGRQHWQNSQNSEYRTPPHDERAERSVLGAMLLNQDVVIDVVDKLRSDDFYFPANQLIFNAIVDLYSDASEIDVLIVAGRLDRFKQLERVGGACLLYTSDAADDSWFV